MRKKRKGSEILLTNKEEDICESRVTVSNLRPHYSLEDCARLKKRCKEDAVGNETVGSCKGRPAGIAATAPPCGSSSMVLPTRGLKRKIGCIDIATQMGRKNKIDDDYVAGEKIGKGKFGSVWLCRSIATGVKFACKTLVKGEETVHREVEIMQHLSGHPGVVMLEAVYEDSDSFHLVMELCSGGRLIDQMAKEGPYSEQKAANVFKELMLVIKYCHEMGVVHRDIKPENILLSNSGKIKLADFGLALRIANGQKLSGLAGSPAYVAPEVLLDNYSEKVDVWSAGILLHALLTGSLPFQGESLEAVFEAIKTSKLDFRTGVWESISKPAKDLMERILTRDAAKRISADEVLRHPWILFYTERTLRTLSFKAKSRSHSAPSRSHSAPPPEQSAFISTKLEDVEIKTTGGSFGTCANSAPLPGSEADDSTEKDDCDFVDALAVAISHVRISEPKRSRLCGPTSPIREQCSSNLQTNNLCRAF